MRGGTRELPISLLLIGRDRPCILKFAGGFAGLLQADTLDSPVNRGSLSRPFLTGRGKGERWGVLALGARILKSLSTVGLNRPKKSVAEI